MKGLGRVVNATVCAISCVIALPACAGFVGEVFMNRTATLVVRVVTPDARTGVPCTATALLAGEAQAYTEVVAGADVTLTVGMMTPLKVRAPVKARVALRVACEGYAPATTPVRDIEVSAAAPPKVDFGQVSVGVAKP